MADAATEAKPEGQEQGAATEPEQVRVPTEIVEARKLVQSRLSNWQQSKDQAATDKTLFDRSVKDLLGTIDELSAPNLFNQPKDGEQAPPDAAVNPDAWWQGRPIAALELPETLETKLADAEIVTLGDLQAIGEQDDGFRSIAGIGPSKAKLIEDAFLKFWEDNKDKLAEPTPDAGDGKDAQAEPSDPKSNDPAYYAKTVSDIGLKPLVRDALHRIHLHRVGDVIAYLDDGNQLTDINGIGEASNNDINLAIDAERQAHEQEEQQSNAAA